MDSEHELSIGETIRALRKRAGWTQRELASKAGLHHHQVVSAIENGERSVKATELARLAAVFHVEPGELLSGRVPAAGQPVLWRQVRDEALRKTEEETFLQRCRRYAFVERITGERTGPTLSSFSLNIGETSYETVERWAEQTARAMELGEVPALTLRKVLEEHAGIKVFLAPLRGGSGAAARGDFGDGILENRDEPPGRRAFSLGHELFHILTWDTAKSVPAEMETRNEQLANVFASALMLPAAKVRALVGGQEIERWPWHRFLPLAESMAVSPPAFLWRLVHMKLLTKARAQELLSTPHRQSGAGLPGGAAPEPELPRRFVLLSFRAWADGLISVGKLAELLETTVGMLEPRLAEYGLDLDGDLDEAEALPA